MCTNVTTLLHPHDIQILAFVELAEVRDQILDHHVYTRWSLIGLYPRVIHMKFAGTVVDNVVLGEIRDLKTKLRYQFNRKLARLLALTLNDDYVRTKIPDPPIHFSGPTNFFGPKIDFTNHQFETSVLDRSFPNL